MPEFNLDTALKKVHERNTDLREQQEQLTVAGRGRLDPDSPENRVARAKQLEASLNEELTFLKQQPDSDLKTMRINRIMDRMGELAAEQGDYEHAASVSVDPRRRAHYESIVDAIQKPDDETCECEDDLLIDRVQQKEFKSPAVLTIERILTPDGMKNLDRCRKCNHLNAR